MSRATTEEVRAIINTTLDDVTLQVWIDAASAIVDQNQDCIGGDDEKLKKVELYLSAHLVAMLDPALRGFVTKEGPPGFETTYSNPVVMKDTIDGTPYGTTANMLSNGCLATANDKSISLCALGGS